MALHANSISPKTHTGRTQEAFECLKKKKRKINFRKSTLTLSSCESPLGPSKQIGQKQKWDKNDK